MKWKSMIEEDGYYKIISTNETVNTKAGIFDKCIVVDEFIKTKNALYHMRKYYAPNVGRVLEEWYDGDVITSRIELESIEYNNSSNKEVERSGESIFTGSMRDSNSEKYTIKIFSDNGTYEVQESPSFIGNVGDIVLKGNLQINYNKEGTEDINKITIYLNDEKSNFTLNLNTENFKIISNSKENEPDILIVTNPMSSNLMILQAYYIYNKQLEPILFDNSGHKSKYLNTATFIEQVSDNNFESSVYDNTNGLNYIYEWEFDSEKGVFTNKSSTEIKENINEQTVQSKSITADEAVNKVEEVYGNHLQYQYYGNLEAGEILDGFPTEKFYIINALQDGEILPGGCFYVNMNNGEVYFNGSSGFITRLSDNQTVGRFGELPKDN
ncbi:hypothetical protein [Clostridium sartagoforme]|nr:hypothetical protein [Clostridium sartagoforme]